MSTLKATNLQHASSSTVNIVLDSSANATINGNGVIEGDLKFDSGFGSAATAYGVRAWINFAGDGSNIGSGRGSGNMDAVTDSGTGRYVMNFTNDMPDTNYSAYGSCAGDSSTTGDESKITFAHTSRAVGSIAVRVVDPVDDPFTVSIAIIR